MWHILIIFFSLPLSPPRSSPPPCLPKIMFLFSIPNKTKQTKNNNNNSKSMESILRWLWFLSMGPVLGWGWYTQCHSTGEDWVSLSQPISTANSFMIWGGLCPLSLLCAGKSHRSCWSPGPENLTKIKKNSWETSSRAHRSRRSIQR